VWRDPQFPADNGGQFTATLSHDMDIGTVTVYGRVAARQEPVHYTDSLDFNRVVTTSAPIPASIR